MRDRTGKRRPGGGGGVRYVPGRCMEVMVHLAKHATTQAGDVFFVAEPHLSEQECMSDRLSLRQISE